MKSVKALLTVLSLFDLLQRTYAAVPPCSDIAYPIGICGGNGDTEFLNLDVSSDGNLVVVVGDSFDTNICGIPTHARTPLVQMWSTQTKKALWGYCVPVALITNPYQSMDTVVFKSDNTKVAAGLKAFRS